MAAARLVRIAFQGVLPVMVRGESVRMVREPWWESRWIAMGLREVAMVIALGRVTDAWKIGFTGLQVHGRYA